jgi:hypothetical protein
MEVTSLNGIMMPQYAKMKKNAIIKRLMGLIDFNIAKALWVWL